MTAALETAGLPVPVLAELDRLAGQDGSLEAPVVVEAARARNSPLHSYFTWNTKTAAEERRLDQARNLIRSYKIRISIDTASGELRELLVRGFTAAKRAGIDNRPPGTYVPTAGLPPQHREVLLRQMAREISAMRQRFGALPEFWELIGGLADDGPAAASGG